MATLQDGKPVSQAIDFDASKTLCRQLTDNTLLTRCGQFIVAPKYKRPEQAGEGGLE